MDSSDGSVGAETMLELINATRDGDLAAVRALIASITAGGGGAVAAKDDQALEGAGNQPAAATIAAHELPTALVTLLPPSSTVTSALTLAVCLGHNDIVAYFVKDLGCDCNADSPRVGTPLQSAATHGNGEAVKLLVEGGGDINALDTSGYTPFKHAIYMDWPSTARTVLNCGGDPYLMTALETWAVVYHEGRADTLGEETRALYDQPRAECYLGRGLRMYAAFEAGISLLSPESSRADLIASLGPGWAVVATLPPELRAAVFAAVDGATTTPASVALGVRGAPESLISLAEHAPFIQAMAVCFYNARKPLKRWTEASIPGRCLARASPSFIATYAYNAVARAAVADARVRALVCGGLEAAPMRNLIARHVWMSHMGDLFSISISAQAVAFSCTLFDTGDDGSGPRRSVDFAAEAERLGAAGHTAHAT